MSKATRDEVVQELILLITKAVNLQHMDTSKLNAETVLVRLPSSSMHSSGNTPTTLGLDSIDILEAVVVVEHRYGIKIDDPSKGEEIFRTFGTIADYVLSQQKDLNSSEFRENTP